MLTKLHKNRWSHSLVEPRDRQRRDSPGPVLVRRQEPEQRQGGRRGGRAELHLHGGVPLGGEEVVRRGVPPPPHTCVCVGGRRERASEWQTRGAERGGRVLGAAGGTARPLESGDAAAVDERGRSCLLYLSMSLSLTSHGSQIALSPLPRHSLTLTTLFLSLGGTTWIRDAWRWDGTCSEQVLSDLRRVHGISQLRH